MALSPDHHPTVSAAVALPPLPVTLPPTAQLQVARPEALSWTVAWARPGFGGRLGLVLLLLLGLLPVVPRFYHFIQSRPGRLLADPLLDLLPVRDVSGLTFTLIYGSLVAMLVYLVPRPQLLLRALWGYYFLQLLRILTLWLVPLEPPTALVILHDPVIDRIFEVTAQPIVRDLFFSGHTATMALLALAVRGPWQRGTLALMTVAVGTLVLVQRVHYSYDVLAAPVFAWLAYWLAEQVARPAMRVRL